MQDANELLIAAEWMEEFIEAVNEDRVTQNQRDLYSSMMATARRAALFAAAPDMLAELAQSKIALQHAANTFYRYAKLHRAKETDEGDTKACANASMGEEMNEAIARIDALLIKMEAL